MTKEIDLSQPDINPAHYMFENVENSEIKEFIPNEPDLIISEDDEIIVNYIVNGRYNYTTVTIDGFHTPEETYDRFNVILRPEFADTESFTCKQSNEDFKVNFDSIKRLGYRWYTSKGLFEGNESHKKLMLKLKPIASTQAPAAETPAKPERKVIQICNYESARDYHLAALCNDGKVFILSDDEKWDELPPIPQPNEDSNNGD